MMFSYKTFIIFHYYAHFSEAFTNFSDMGRGELTEATQCKIPCSFMEFKVNWWKSSLNWSYLPIFPIKKCTIFKIYYFNLFSPADRRTSSTWRKNREIKMREIDKQPLLCSLPLWVVELGLVAESCWVLPEQLAIIYSQLNCFQIL